MKTFNPIATLRSPRFGMEITVNGDHDSTRVKVVDSDAEETLIIRTFTEAEHRHDALAYAERYFTYDADSVTTFH